LNVQFIVGVPGAQGPSSASSSSAPTKNENVESSNSAAVPAAPGVTAVSGGSHQQQYWAKGTGFGTGSTAQTWDLDGAMHRQRQQEEQATCLLHTLAAYISPVSPDQSSSPPVSLPSDLLSIIQSSHLVAAICSYLRNDSGNSLFFLMPLQRIIRKSHRNRSIVTPTVKHSKT